MDKYINIFYVYIYFLKILKKKEEEEEEEEEERRGEKSLEKR